MTVSMVTTSSCPGDGATSAASSFNPSAPGVRASGANRSAMSWNSPRRVTERLLLLGARLQPAERAGNLVEHRIHHARLRAGIESVPDVDEFGNRHFRGH